MKKTYRKRPCRSCRIWFKPSVHGGHKQKTCGRDECRRKWHRRMSREWRVANPGYALENRLGKKLREAKDHEMVPAQDKRQRQSALQYPHRIAKEVMGGQQAAFIEFMLKVLFSRVQEVMGGQLPKNKGFVSKVVGSPPKGVIAPGDGTG